MIDYKVLNGLISGYFDDFDKDNYLFENLMMIGRVCRNIDKQEIEIKKEKISLDNLKALSLASEFFLSINKKYSSIFEVMVKDTKINFYEKEEQKIVNSLNIPSKETMDDLYLLVESFLKINEKNPLKYFISMNLLPIFLQSKGYTKVQVNYYILEKYQQLKKLYPLVNYFSLLFEIYLNYFKINERSVDKILTKEEDKQKFIEMSDYFLKHSDVIHMESVIAYVFDQVLALVIAEKLNENVEYYKIYRTLNGQTNYEDLFETLNIDEENIDLTYKKRVREMSDWIDEVTED